MSYTLYELARNPDIQEKLRLEIRRVKTKHGGLTYQAVKEMTYLDNVLNGKGRAPKRKVLLDSASE